MQPIGYEIRRPRRRKGWFVLLFVTALHLGVVLALEFSTIGRTSRDEIEAAGSTAEQVATAVNDVLLAPLILLPISGVGVLACFLIPANSLCWGLAGWICFRILNLRAECRAKGL